MAVVCDFQLKQKEQKILQFTFRNPTTKAIIPLIGCIFKLVVENKKGEEVIVKDDADFDKVNVANGIIRVTLTESNLDLDAGEYVMAIKTIFSNGEIDKSRDYKINLIASIID